MKVKEVPYFILLLFIVISCSSQTNDTCTNNLIEKRIGKSNLYVCLPPDYELEFSQGIDFGICYFKAIDPTVVPEFSGGFYLGNHPNEFEPENDSCKTSLIEDYLFNFLTKWKVHICNGEFTVQSIVYYDSGEGMNNQIHTFGTGKSAKSLDKLMEIFSTMKVK